MEWPSFIATGTCPAPLGDSSAVEGAIMIGCSQIDDFIALEKDGERALYVGAFGNGWNLSQVVKSTEKFKQAVLPSGSDTATPKELGLTKPTRYIT